MKLSFRTLYSKEFLSKSGFISFLVFLFALMWNPSDSLMAKKIKQSLKIKKEKTEKSRKENQKLLDHTIHVGDSALFLSKEGYVKSFFPEQVSFAGYEKEANSSLESFIVINKSAADIIGFTIEIVYQDMQGRMLHRRQIEQSCDIPENESRKFDIKSWDKQRTYYYYRGNSPRKTATPYKVEFIPVSFKIKNAETLLSPDN